MPHGILVEVWWWKAILGAGIVLFTVVEMFQDLFHPTRSGALSEWIGKHLFRVFRRWPSLLGTAGPLAVVVVIFTWAILLAAGFAFIYWAAFPANFQLKTANRPSEWNGFWWSFYYSLEMMTTLGLGDIQPNPNWLRILSACHTLIGFSLVTASITWIVLLYPALTRTRTLARKAATFAETEQQTGVPVVSTGMHNALAALAEEVIRTRVDLVHFPILFYFYGEDKKASLPHAFFPLMHFAAAGMEPGRDDLVRLASTALHVALGDIAQHIGERMDVPDRSPEEVFRRFAELHSAKS